MKKKAANILQLKKQAFLLFAFGDAYLYIARNPAMTGEPKTNVGRKERHNSCSTQGTELNLCWVHLDDCYYHAFPPTMMSTQHLGEQGNLPPMHTASLPTSTRAPPLSVFSLNPIGSKGPQEFNTCNVTCHLLFIGESRGPLPQTVLHNPTLPLNTDFNGTDWWGKWGCGLCGWHV